MGLCAARRELTRHEHWSGFVKHWGDGSTRSGVQLSLPLPTAFESPFTAAVDPSKGSRMIRRMTGAEDGASIRHVNVTDFDPGARFVSTPVARPDGNFQLTWNIEKEAAAREDGCTHPAFPDPRVRTFLVNGLAAAGARLAVTVTIRLPGDRRVDSPLAKPWGEFIFGEKDWGMSVIFRYGEVSADGVDRGIEGAGRFEPKAFGVILEERLGRDPVDGAVDFGELPNEFREAQLPADSAAWVSGGGWTGQRSTFELEGGKLWVSEGEAVWSPPDPLETSMALLLTPGEGYFYGPRVLETGGAGDRVPVVLEAGTRISEDRMQRAVVKYDMDGNCVRIDHELFVRAGSQR